MSRLGDLLVMHWRLGVAIVAVLVVGCAGTPVPSPIPSTQPASPSALAPSPSPSGPSWTYVAFGDSWPYGAHCNGCRPFPILYAQSVGETTGRRIDFINLTRNGGGAQTLLGTITGQEAIRDQIGAADIVVIATGGNDLEPAFEASAAGTCGGADGLDCFRTINEKLRGWFDGILTEIQDLRVGRPTAVRLVTASNEFLADPGLIELFGTEFGKTGGVAITRMQREMLCDVAAHHGAVCVDIALTLNGPDLLVPRDVNTQTAMQAVADAILATGLDELH